MGLLGDYLASKRSQQAARSANRFTEYMSSTAYQRGMKDMKLAGLNPILAYKQGGATGGQGAMPHFSSTGDVLGTAVDATRATTAKKTGKTQRGVHSAQQQQAQTAAKVNSATVGKIHSETGRIAADTTLKNQQTREHAARADRAEFDNVGAALDANLFGTGRGKFLREAQQWGRGIGGFLSGVTGGVIGSAVRRRGRGTRPGRSSSPLNDYRYRGNRSPYKSRR